MKFTQVLYCFGFGLGILATALPSFQSTLYNRPLITQSDNIRGPPVYGVPHVLGIPEPAKYTAGFEDILTPTHSVRTDNLKYGVPIPVNPTPGFSAVRGGQSVNVDVKDRIKRFVVNDRTIVEEGARGPQVVYRYRTVEDIQEPGNAYRRF